MALGCGLGRGQRKFWRISDALNGDCSLESSGLGWRRQRSRLTDAATQEENNAVFTALLVDESPEFLLRHAQTAGGLGFNVLTADSIEEARDVLLRELPELVILGDSVTARSSLPRLESILRRPELASLIEVHAVADQDNASALASADRLGASEVHGEDFGAERFREILEDYLARAETAGSDGEVHESGRGLLVGESQPMLRLYSLMRKIATTDVSALISGESGTGKELVSRTIHELSQRSDGRFVAANAGAIPENLAESELFGHVRGAFSGAEEDREGLIERADGGTLFLDEITEMPEAVQVKLLRVLETGTFQRLGESETRRSDFRLIAACNRDPQEAVEEGVLRADVFYRIAQFPLSLPPLRAREDDVRLLAQHFLEQESRNTGQHKQWTEEALQTLSLHDWPGNVRELRNVVSRTFILAGEWLRPEDLPPELGRSGNTTAPSAAGFVGQSIDDMERSLVLETLKKTDGNKQQAAELLGISRKTLYARLKDYGQDDGSS